MKHKNSTCENLMFAIRIQACELSGLFLISFVADFGFVCCSRVWPAKRTFAVSQTSEVLVAGGGHEVGDENEWVQRRR